MQISIDPRKCFEWKQCNIALHGAAHVDAIDACLVLCSMDTHGTHCDQVMKTGAFSVAKVWQSFSPENSGASQNGAYLFEK